VSQSYTVAYTCELHEVKAGDTLWNISKRYPGTTPEWIAEINEITDYIRIGEVLCIPIQP
jgi:LysM repeat protein